MNNENYVRRESRAMALGSDIVKAEYMFVVVYLAAF